MKIYSEVEKDIELTPEEIREEFFNAGAEIPEDVDPVEALDKIWKWIKRKLDA